MATIHLEGLTKIYPGDVRAVDNLELSIVDGEFFALLGPSGCGKTTLLRTIAGLEEATSGSVWIGDRDVTHLAPGKRELAMVFQDYALFPHMSVADNISYPLKIKGLGKPERLTKAAEAGEELSLAGLMERRPGELSGGQQQRVALARAIATHPHVFLFDEPLSNLDARLRLEARTFLKRLQRELGVTTVFVTHDQAEALAMADRMAVMDAGRIRQVGTAREVFQRPANTFVANFIGSTPMNLMTAVIRGGALEISGQRIPTPEDVRAHVTDGQDVVVGIRPEYLTLSQSAVDGALRGVVAIVENLGTSALVSLEADGFTVAATVADGAEPLIGADAWVSAPSSRTLVYRGGDGELVEAPVGAAGGMTTVA